MSLLLSIVRLEHHQLADEPEQRPSREEQAALPPRAGQRRRHQQEDEAHVLHIEPEPGVLVVHPVPVQTQEAAGGRLLEGEAQQLRRRQRRGDEPVAQKQAQPAAQAQAVGDEQDERDDPQRQEGVGVYQRQAARQHAQGQEKPVLVQYRRAVEQVQAGEEQRPAEERRPLRYQHVRDWVHPVDALVRVVGGSGVESAQDLGYAPAPGLGEVEEIGKAEAAAHEEEIERQRRRATPAQPGLEEQIGPRDDQQVGVHRRQQRRKTQARAQRVEGGADAVAEEGVAYGRPGQERILRREALLHGDAADYAEVHTHIPVGALARVERAVRGRDDHVVQHKHPADEHERQYAEEKAPLPGEAQAGPPAQAQADRAQDERQHQRLQLRPNVEAARDEGEERREPHQHHEPGDKPQPEPEHRPVPTENKPRDAHSRGREYEQI